jgi:hypothetical protein
MLVSRRAFQPIRLNVDQVASQKKNLYPVAKQKRHEILVM